MIKICWGSPIFVFAKCFGVFLCAFAFADGLNDDDNGDAKSEFFIAEIFNKYGNNNSITYEGFEHLLENLGLGKLKFETNHDVAIHKVNGTFMEFHDALSLHKHNHAPGIISPAKVKRNLIKDESEMNKVVDKSIRKKCLTPQDILITFGLQPHHDVLISPAIYMQLCPAIVYELDQKLCQIKEEATDKTREAQEQHLVWIYASICIFVMGVSGSLCILIVPIIMKNVYSSLMQFLIALAVGTLCGDAFLHLLPQVFSKYGSIDSEITLIFKGTTVLMAVILFFLFESVLKGVKAKNKSKLKKDQSSILIQKHADNEHYHNGSTDHTLAWMAILGDILHNVTDGLSIGAAFETRLSAGFASSIAIFCHELPHELGDYAILIASGMSIKKSLCYNILSSVFSVGGMIAGILLGEINNAALWINAFTAGSFLYVALSDLLPEMKMMTSKTHPINYAVQLGGICCGGILMFVIAVYEDKIENFLY